MSFHKIGLGLIVVLAAVVAAHAQHMSVMCQYFECPTYKQIGSSMTYEEREYAKEKWIVASAANVTDINYSRMELFKHLLEYMSGSNVQNRVLNITLPFLTKAVRAVDSDVTATLSMYFFLPRDAQTAPPTPKDARVSVVYSPVKTVYATSFWGWTSKGLVSKTRKDLQKHVGVPRLYDNSHFYLATYSSPLQMKNRYNELWISRNHV